MNPGFAFYTKIQQFRSRDCTRGCTTKWPCEWNCRLLASNEDTVSVFGLRCLLWIGEFPHVVFSFFSLFAGQLWCTWIITNPSCGSTVGFSDPLDLPHLPYPKSVGSRHSLTLHTVGRVWGAPIYLGPIETPAAGGSKRPSAFGANAPCAQSEVYDSETMGYRCSLGVSSLHGSSPVAL